MSINRVQCNWIWYGQGILCMCFYYFTCAIKRQILNVDQRKREHSYKSYLAKPLHMFLLLCILFNWMNNISGTLMDDCYVLGGNLSFPSSLPGPMGGSGYHLCGQYPGTPPAGQISRITWQPQPVSAQYVYIQLDRSTSPSDLEMCEVWVYGSKLTTLYLRLTSIAKSMHLFTALVIRLPKFLCTERFEHCITHTYTYHIKRIGWYYQYFPPFIVRW